MEVEGSGEGHVTAVSEGSDDQAARVTQIFIAVLELGVGLTHDTVVILLKRNTATIYAGIICLKVRVGDSLRCCEEVVKKSWITIIIQYQIKNRQIQTSG